MGRDRRVEKAYPPHPSLRSSQQRKAARSIVKPPNNSGHESGFSPHKVPELGVQFRPKNRGRGLEGDAFNGKPDKAQNDFTSAAFPSSNIDPSVHISNMMI
jgi:hypothetical protein